MMFSQLLRQCLKFLSLLCLTVLLPVAAQAAGAENGTFSGRVVDISGMPVAGAEVYVYTVSNIRRPADFIAPPADDRGEFRITLPPGRYWTVARFRQGEERYGPLLPGDRHSGDPLEIDILTGEETSETFTVADLEETSRLSVKFDTSFIRIEGILTEDGQPVENAYAFANQSAGFRKIPDYISTWSDSSGSYTLFLPPGTYYLGLADQFPPENRAELYQKVVIDSSTGKINIEMPR